MDLLLLVYRVLYDEVVDYYVMDYFLTAVVDVHYYLVVAEAVVVRYYLVAVVAVHYGFHRVVLLRVLLLLLGVVHHYHPMIYNFYFLVS